VKYCVGLNSCYCALYIVKAADIAVHEFKISFIAKPQKVSLRTVAIKTIEYAEFDASGYCMFRQIGAKEAATSGYQ
jgi:hypothetical protein